MKRRLRFNGYSQRKTVCVTAGCFVPVTELVLLDKGLYPEFFRLCLLLIQRMRWRNSLVRHRPERGCRCRNFRFLPRNLPCVFNFVQMDKTAQPEFLKELKQAVLSHDEKAEVILYGSRARGDFGEESDWDVLVLTSGRLTNKAEADLRDRIYDIELEHAQSLSTIILDKATWDHWEVMPLHRNVTKEGVAL